MRTLFSGLTKKIALAFYFFSFASGTFACEFSEVLFDTDFSAARLSDCKQRSDNSFLLTVKPENSPINNSPWYAFKVSAKNKKKIRVAIEFVDGDHRYLPKISHDGIQWSSIPYRVKNKKLTFSLNIDKEPVLGCRSGNYHQ